MDLSDLRRDYRQATMDESSVAADPIEQFARWFEAARHGGVAEPNGMMLATVNAQGQPSARIVLLKGFSEDGFVFYTDRRSRKGSDLEANPAAALVFWWHELERQVRITGTCVRHDDAASDAYFAERPRGSQLGAWASTQSSTLSSREELQSRVESARARFDEAAVPRPSYWGGYCLKHESVEFWQGRPDRLHDRLLYTRTSELGWRIARLSP